MYKKVDDFMDNLSVDSSLDEWCGPNHSEGVSSADGHPKSIVHYENERSSIYNSILPLMLILLLLFTEWVLRKKFIEY